MRVRRVTVLQALALAALVLFVTREGLCREERLVRARGRVGVRVRARVRARVRVRGSVAKSTSRHSAREATPRLAEGGVVPVPVALVELPVVVWPQPILLMPKSDSDLVRLRLRLRLRLGLGSGSGLGPVSGSGLGSGLGPGLGFGLESHSDRLNVPPSPCLGAFGGGGESPPPAVPPAPLAKALCWRCVFAPGSPLCAAGKGSESSKHPSRVCETWLGLGLGLVARARARARAGVRVGAGVRGRVGVGVRHVRPGGRRSTAPTRGVAPRREWRPQRSEVGQARGGAASTGPWPALG